MIQPGNFLRCWKANSARNRLQTMPIKITKNEHDHNYKSAKWRSFLGGGICLSLSVIGFWIAFYGDGANMQGGIPFVAELVNQMIARVVFGIGAVISGLISILAFRELVGTQKK